MVAGKRTMCIHVLWLWNLNWHNTTTRIIDQNQILKKKQHQRFSNTYLFSFILKTNSKSNSKSEKIQGTALDVVQARIEFPEKVVAVLSQVLRIHCIGVARKEPILWQAGEISTGFLGIDTDLHTYDGSMVLVYMLTWLGYINGKCYHIWHKWVLWDVINGIDSFFGGMYSIIVVYSYL